MLSDDGLARLAGEGHERAFAALYGRFHQPLYRYCLSLLRHDADAQDALQSTFASAVVALRRGQRDAPVRPWLFRIAHNESISVLRKRRPISELTDTLEATTLSVEATVDERQRLTQLVADLQALPERQRGALVMRELNGLSHEELAQALGISVGAAKQTVFEARKALGEFEEGRAMACDEILKVISDGDRRVLRGRRVRAHLRQCSGCTAFATAIPQRRADLLALSPALPAAAAAGLLTKITGPSSAHHGGGGLLAGAAGKGVGAAVSTKAFVTGVAIVATAAAGAAGIVKVVDSSDHSSPPAAAHRHANHGTVARSSGSSRGVSSAGVHASNAAAAGSAASGRAAQGNLPIRALGVRAGAPFSVAGQAGSSGSSLTTGVQHGNGQSGSGTTNPNAHGGNGNAGGTNAGSGSSNPNAHGGNPNSQGGNSHSHSGSTNAHGGNPNAGGGNSNAGGSSSTSHGSTPNAGGGNPNAGGGNSNAGGSSSTSHGGSPNAGGGNPNAGGANSHGHGHL